MQRMFKYGNIPNTTLTLDEQLNILIYWTPSYVIICKNYTLLKMVRFLAHPVVAIRIVTPLQLTHIDLADVTECFGANIIIPLIA